MNNPMRSNPKASPARADDMKRVKEAGNHLHDMIESFGPSRESSLAKTKLEECIMWAVKDLTTKGDGR
jgi:hypothetical protein